MKAGVDDVCAKASIRRDADASKVCGYLSNISSQHPGHGLERLHVTTVERSLTAGVAENTLVRTHGRRLTASGMSNDVHASYRDATETLTIRGRREPSIVDLFAVSPRRARSGWFVVRDVNALSVRSCSWHTS